jgi:hypothetical protein
MFRPCDTMARSRAYNIDLNANDMVTLSTDAPHFLSGISEQMVNLTGLVVAVVALAIAIYSWITASRAARNDVLAQVRDWGGDVVDLLADSRALCELGKQVDSNEVVKQRTELRSRASALVDRGRFFFPNSGGIRLPILNLVMIAYELVPRIAEHGVDSRRLNTAFDYLQSVFVSTVKQAVNFSAVPATVKKYEEHLIKIKIQQLPLEIRDMMAGAHKFNYMFADLPLIPVPPRDPKPSN